MSRRKVNFGHDPDIEPDMKCFTSCKAASRFAATAGLALLAVPSLTSCRESAAPTSNASAQPSASSSPTAASTQAPATASTPTSSPAPAPPGSSTGSAPTAARACRADDLRVTTGPVGAGAGQRYTTLNFRALPGHTCVLRNDLTGVRFLRGDGAPLPTHVRRTGGSGAAIPLRPGVTAQLDLHFTVVGAGRFTPEMLKFTVPGGGTATVAWPHGVTVGDDGRLELGRLHR